MRLAPATLAALAVLAAGPVRAQEPSAPSRPYLAVRGEGVTKAKPDVARLSVVLATRAPTLEAASRAHGPRAKQAAELLAKLEGNGLKVSESAFTLGLELKPQPGMGDVSRQAKPEGVATTRFRVEIKPVDGLDAAVSSLAETGLLEIERVSYALDDPRAETNKARRLAMEDARDQAKVLSEAGGFRLVEIVGVSDGQANTMQVGEADIGIRAMRSAAPMQAAPPSTIDTTASIAVTWRIDGKPAEPAPR